MDRFDREYLDILKSNADQAEQRLKAAIPAQVDRLLYSFIQAKEDYISYKKKFDLD